MPKKMKIRTMKLYLMMKEEDQMKQHKQHLKCLHPVITPGWYPLILPPYPNRLKPKTKKMEELEKEILNTFKKVEINIPLLDVVRQIPRYAKFLKELCTHKRRIMDKEVVNMGRNV